MYKPKAKYTFFSYITGRHLLGTVPKLAGCTTNYPSLHYLTLAFPIGLLFDIDK